MATVLNPDRVAARRAANRIHAVLILGALLSLAALLGLLLAGITGLIWGLVLGGASMALGRASPRLILRLYGARPLSAVEAGVLRQILTELARRAELPRVPALYYVPSPVPNAFAVGDRGNAAIAVTDRLLRTLDTPELSGVLAHEISHIRNGDLSVMMLADVASRITSMFAMIGQLLLLLNLPLLMAGRETVPWMLIIVLMLAPTATALLQLALSRTREFDADLEAALLTGDPRALASALARMENQTRGIILGHVLLPGRRVPEPSLFRTHPRTEERIRRLLEIEEAPDVRRRGVPGAPFAMPEWSRPVTRDPRWRIGGLWY